jgi:hypothetical protein
MYRRTASLLISLLALSIAPTAWSAAPLRVMVDRRGTLRFPAAVLKALGLKPDSSGNIAIEFPDLQRKKLTSMRGHAPDSTPERAPKVWIPVGRDGSLKLLRTKLVPANEYVPAKPGTVYTVTAKEGRLVLRLAAGRR